MEDPPTGGGVTATYIRKFRQNTIELWMSTGCGCPRAVALPEDDAVEAYRPPWGAARPPPPENSPPKAL
ncbi:unnamed protein product [Gadus morhua 'NCC']